MPQICFPCSSCLYSFLAQKIVFKFPTKKPSCCSCHPYSSLSLSLSHSLLPLKYIHLRKKNIYFYVLSSNYFKHSKINKAAFPLALLEERGPVICKSFFYVILNIQKRLIPSCLFGEAEYNLSVFEIWVENVFIADFAVS